MAKKDLDDIEDWDDLEDEDNETDNDESEDDYSSEYSGGDNFSPEPHIEPQAQSFNEGGGNLWGTIFWILVVLVGGYYLFFNSDSSSNVQTSNYAYPSPSPVARYSPALRYQIPTYYTPPRYFGSYECTEDCSGHEAGYEWASDNDIDNYDDCGGNSDSFIEGCYSYVEDNYPENVEE